MAEDVAAAVGPRWPPVLCPEDWAGYIVDQSCAKKRQRECEQR